MIERALIVRQPHLDKILSGLKLWEMRSTMTNVRGVVGLIEQGSGLIVGEVEITGCRQPIETRTQAFAFGCLHHVDDLDLLKKWRFPWVLANAKRYDKPKPYNHPAGAVIWVKVNPEDFPPK